MGKDGQIEPSQPVTAEGVGTALYDDGGGSVGYEDGFDDGFEEGYVGRVVDAVSQGDVETVMFSGSRTYFIIVSSPGEEVLGVVFVEGEGEYSIC